ncbi:riboflavin synthase [Aliarcobacter butzleri]|uniref:Riboflavin synthase n=1 Tax=Aliarcobacter butzleri TaxID=28197 RepID=A0AAP4PZC1_9BACT|nr:riboflavin synthase [Aliarcobacter butzleri]MDK2091750.1 riboflavin synthase [Aliarcobacter butzleri]MDN5051992.1 riboflavin synthase [Aliarcobacter butzleri]MDN5074687.1 riboflavin synthase [Aliarcobacter butzleri]MDN5116250.1 riboflavin synthase [Aliarcobacter butzleri]MDN5132074.1 riboflavin synthase [Aliarcobacter butzleri]
MFTGLIREMAKVVSFKNNFLTLKAKYHPKIGDSIAINGACLTVVKITNETFTVELSPESQKILAMENYKNEVHIEPAMMMGDRFEGHIVQGHVDCLGTVKAIKQNGNSTDFFISLPKEYSKYIIPKGSVTIDGVSLTVNEVLKDEFRLTIIPHTIENTLFKNYKIGTKVNLETDMFARYIYNMFKNKKDTLSWGDVDRIMASY